MPLSPEGLGAGSGSPSAAQPCHQACVTGLRLSTIPAYLALENRQASPAPTMDNASTGGVVSRILGDPANRRSNLRQRRHMVWDARCPMRCQRFAVVVIRYSSVSPDTHRSNAVPCSAGFQTSRREPKGYVVRCHGLVQHGGQIDGELLQRYVLPKLRPVRGDAGGAGGRSTGATRAPSPRRMVSWVCRGGRGRRRRGRGRSTRTGEAGPGGDCVRVSTVKPSS